MLDCAWNCDHKKLKLIKIFPALSKSYSRSNSLCIGLNIHVFSVFTLKTFEPIEIIRKLYSYTDENRKHSRQL